MTKMTPCCSLLQLLQLWGARSRQAGSRKQHGREREAISQVFSGRYDDS